MTYDSFLLQKEFTDDCIFNETMQGNYNIYSSSFHSNAQKTFYLALNKMGEPRKTHLPANKELGKLATYAKSITLTVPENRTEQLIGRIFGTNHVKHGLKQLCDSGKSLIELTAKKLKPKLKCGGSSGGSGGGDGNNGGTGKRTPKGKRPNAGVLVSSPVDKVGRKNASKCSSINDPAVGCGRKKKNNQKGAARVGNSGNSPKHKLKKQIHNRRNSKKVRVPTTTRRTTTPTTAIDVITTTPAATSMTSINDNDDDLDVIENGTLSSSSTESHDQVDEWDDTTIGQTAFADDDDIDEFDH